MAHPYWYGVTVQFPCDSCGALSTEKFGINAETNDIETVKKIVNRQPHECQRCHRPPLDGTVVGVGILSDTRESLFRQGYEVPEMPGDTRIDT
jgi:hypothetical protein